MLVGLLMMMRFFSSRNTLRCSLLGATLAGGAAQAEPGCLPVVVIEGADGLVSQIATILKQHGILSDPSACPASVVHVVVNVVPDGEAFRLRIQDTYGRVSERLVPAGDSAAPVAASLIETWVLDEAADLLTPRPQKTSVSASPTPDVVHEGRGTTGFRSGLSGEIKTATDGSLWFGGVLGLCGRVWRSCLGLQVHLDREDNGGGLSGDLKRTQASGYVSGSLPMSSGAWVFLPRIGAGVAWTHSTLLPSPWTVSADDYDVRVEVAMRVGRRFSRSWAIAAEMGGEAGTSLSRAPRNFLGTFIPEPPGASLTWALGLEFAP
jgi:hypothetical protein